MVAHVVIVVGIVLVVGVVVIIFVVVVTKTAMAGIAPPHTMAMVQEYIQHGHTKMNYIAPYRYYLMLYSFDVMAPCLPYLDTMIIAVGRAGACFVGRRRCTA